MRIHTLQLHDVRLFEQVELRPAAGLNFVLGANGAGKTTLLEAIHLLGYGRSFRSNQPDSLTRSADGAGLRVFAQCAVAGRACRVGLGRQASTWQARIDGRDCSSLSELCRQISVVCFEPGSHTLLAGPGDVRRRYLDWLLFHVEPDFLGNWQRYRRALKQRNHLLRAGARDPNVYEPWEQELAATGSALHRHRAAQVLRCATASTRLAERFLPELGALSWQYRSGWSDDADLLTVLIESRERDLRLGYTFPGPHRADWRLRFAALPAAVPLSRGQEKLAALACVLAQIEVLQVAGQDLPVVLLDDLASELDSEHQGRVWALLREHAVQVIATGTEIPRSLPPEWIDAVFHVERDGAGATLHRQV